MGHGNTSVDQPQQKVQRGAREMAQNLRVMAALADGPNLVPRPTSRGSQHSPFSAPGLLPPSSGLHKHLYPSEQSYSQTHKNRYVKINLFNKRKQRVFAPL